MAVSARGGGGGGRLHEGDVFKLMPTRAKHGKTEDMTALHKTELPHRA